MMKGKGASRKQPWPNIGFYSGIRLEELRKTTQILSHHSRLLKPRFEPGTSRIRSRSVNLFTSTKKKFSSILAQTPEIFTLWEQESLQPEANHPASPCSKTDERIAPI
jgi:hypothetical protein